MILKRLLLLLWIVGLAAATAACQPPEANAPLGNDDEIETEQPRTDQLDNNDDDAPSTEDAEDDDGEDND